MSEIDWSKAPADASHWCTLHKKWIYNPEWYDDCCIPRPTNQEWESGLPEVGTICEYQLKHDEPHEWSKCVIEFIGDRHVVAKCWPDETMPELEQCFKKREVKFRPLKSQHERQREELVDFLYEHRESAVGELADAILSRYTLDPKP